MTMSAIADSEIFQKAQQYYYGLSERDQLALSLLTIFFGLLLLVFLIIQPAYNFSVNAQQDYTESLETLEWMSANKQRVSTAANNSKRSEGQSLLSIANVSAKNFQIVFKRYEPAGDNGLNLWMSDIAFNQLILWLEGLYKDYGISVDEISVERQQASGLVNVRLVLRG